jgi:hypothetical protein
VPFLVTGSRGDAVVAGSGIGGAFSTGRAGIDTPTDAVPSSATNAAGVANGKGRRLRAAVTASFSVGRAADAR